MDDYSALEQYSLQMHGDRMEQDSFQLIHAELQDDAFDSFMLDNSHRIIESYRVELQRIRRIEIRANRFRIIIKDYRPITALLQRPGAVHTRIIELYPLPNPNRSAAEN